MKIYKAVVNKYLISNILTKNYIDLSNFMCEIDLHCIGNIATKMSLYFNIGQIDEN